MKLEDSKKQGSVIIAIVFSILALATFLYQTEIILNPLILFMVSIFLVWPFRAESQFVKRLITLAVMLFIGWLLSDLGFALMPFAISFLMAYLLDPFVSNLNSRGVPRWAATLIIVLLFLGAVTTTAIFIFPAILSQIDQAVAKISNLVSTFSEYINSENFYNFLTNFGLSEELARNSVENYLAPSLEKLLTGIFEGLSSLLENLSGVATQIVNAILIPILLFYFLKDFDKFTNFLKSVLRPKNKQFLYNLRRINRIFRIYVSWQATAAMIVGIVCSISFSSFGVPYAIVLGIICGFLNPIPYLGVIGSLFISITTILIAQSGSVVADIIVITTTISIMHFINAYFLEPNIAGKQVGLHPLILIASLFIFGGMFGFIGLLVAVPSTATLMMFFNDWRESTIRQSTSYSSSGELDHD